MAKRTSEAIKPLRIAVIGSHGTGKTTLVEALVEKLEIRRIPDVVRMPNGAFDKGFPIDEFTLPESQFWILSKQLEFERNTKMPWISDKSLYDNIIYGEETFNDRRVIDLIKEIVMRNAKYDIILYLAPVFPYKHEGKRSPDPKFHHKIHRSFVKFFKKHQISFIEINEPDFKKRLKQVIEIIKGY